MAERSRSWALVAASGAAAALVVIQSSLDEPARPWQAVVVGALAAAIVAVGYLGGRWSAVALATACVAVAIVVQDLASSSSVPEDEDCVRFCGITLGGQLALTLPVVAALSAVGVVARRLVDAVRRD